MTKVLLIANPKSGTINFNKSISSVKECFKRYDVESTLMKTDYKGHAVDIVKNENLNIFDSVCAMGGDGTLFEVLNGMLSRSADDRVPISIMPNGTGNSFMKTVGTTSEDSAVKIIARSSSRKIDDVVMKEDQAKKREAFEEDAQATAAKVVKIEKKETEAGSEKNNTAALTSAAAASAPKVRRQVRRLFCRNSERIAQSSSKANSSRAWPF